VQRKFRTLHHPVRHSHILRSVRISPLGILLTIRFLFVTFTFIFTSWLLSLSGVLASEDDPQSLRLLITEYLEETDGTKAEGVLTDILKRPDADMQAVEDSLVHGRVYTTQPRGVQSGVPIAVRGRSFGYALYVPSGYQPAKAYPLVLCLHGAGFTGEAYLDRWQSRLNEQYIVACPTMPMGNWWTRDAAEVVLATLRDVQARYHIDPDRMFLTGMSNGGIGVYLIGSHYAPVFAGLAPMASGLDDVLMPFLANLRQTPIYMIHGVHDQVMPVELSRTIAKELTRLGYPFTYREHERTHPVAGGHYFPREELPDLIAWFDRQRRHRFPPHLTVVRDATHLLPFGWVRIDSTSRIAAFSDNLVDRRDEAITHRVYASLDAKIVAPNRIEVSTQRVQRYSLFFNQELIDLSKPVTVLTNGRVSYEGPVTASVETLLREARRRHDRALLFPAVLTIAADSTR
jgi:dienelactone hydrolase